MPETDHPHPPPEEAAKATQPTQPAAVAEDEYHARADEYLDALREKAEQLQESRGDVEVEYSVRIPSEYYAVGGKKAKIEWVFNRMNDAVLTGRQTVFLIFLTGWCILYYVPTQRDLRP